MKCLADTCNEKPVRKGLCMLHLIRLRFYGDPGITSQPSSEQGEDMTHYADNHWNEAPTEKQLAYLEKLGYRGPEPQTKKEAGEAIDRLQPPATERQLDFLAELGWEGEDPESKFAASKLIDKLIEERDAAA